MHLSVFDLKMKKRAGTGLKVEVNVELSAKSLPLRPVSPHEKTENCFLVKCYSTVFSFAYASPIVPFPSKLSLMLEVVVVGGVEPCVLSNMLGKKDFCHILILDHSSMRCHMVL